MVCAFDKTVLTVGLNGKTTALQALPVEVISADRGRDAIQHLREHLLLDAMVSTWDLPDMGNGDFVRRVKAARPWLPTVVLMDKGLGRREATARTLGIAALLPGDVEDYLLQRTIVAVLGLQMPLMSAQRKALRSCDG